MIGLIRRMMGIPISSTATCPPSGEKGAIARMRSVKGLHNLTHAEESNEGEVPPMAKPDCKQGRTCQQEKLEGDEPEGAKSEGVRPGRRARPSREQRTRAKRFYAQLLQFVPSLTSKHCWRASDFSPRHRRKALLKGQKPWRSVQREATETYLDRIYLPAFAAKGDDGKVQSGTYPCSLGDKESAGCLVPGAPIGAAAGNQAAKATHAQFH